MATKKVKFDGLEDLPNGWKWIPLNELMIEPKIDIVDGPFGSNLKASEYVDKGIPIARLQNIDRNQFIFKNIRHISPEKAEELDRHNFMPGDILVTKLGAPLGKACLVPRQLSQGIIVADLVRIRIRNNLINRVYLSYAINSPFPIKQLERHTKGTTRPRVNLGVIRMLPIPVAPKNVQKRIVAEIEKQFSRLDEAIENLKRVKANLKRYKASVLKAAVEGKLTEKWRAEHPDVEPASKLLERILTERRKKWEEAELAKREAKGKVSKDVKWKRKYNIFSKPDAGPFGKMPNGWQWLTSDQLFWFVTSGSRGWAKYYSNTGSVFLRVGNLDHDSVSLDLKKVQYVKPPVGAEGTRTKVSENDILISITADVGMIGVVPKGFEEAYINQHISLARPVTSVNSLYIAWYLTSKQGQYQFGELQRGATKAGLGLDDIRSINIPIPPIEEQAEIVSQIEKCFSAVDVINEEINEKLKSADRLRQSILKKAFSGQLVSSSHEYESDASYELPMAAEAMPTSYSRDIKRKA